MQRGTNNCWNLRVQDGKGQMGILIPDDRSPSARLLLKIAHSSLPDPKRPRLVLSFVLALLALLGRAHNALEKVYWGGVLWLAGLERDHYRWRRSASRE